MPLPAWIAAYSSPLLSGALFLAVGPGERGDSASERSDRFETARSDTLLEQAGLREQLAPEGKRIAYIRTLRDDVFIPGEVFPTWLNVFHARTRERVIRRELLVAIGDTYSQEPVDESMRNLRGIGLFSLVHIVAVQGKDPNEVGLVVYTRDLWSLRAETDFNISSQVNALRLQLIERNLAGLGHSVAVDYQLDPATHDIASSYHVRRFAGRDFLLYSRGGIIAKRRAGNVEGGHARIVVGRPFYHSTQRHGYLAEAKFLRDVDRQLTDGNLETWSPTDSGGVAGNRAWRRQTVFAEASGSLRVGEQWLNTFTLLAQLDERRFSRHADSQVTPGAEAAFEAEVLPESRREIGPGVRYKLFGRRFHVFRNLDAYGTSESVRMGPGLEISARVPFAWLGSTATAGVFETSLGWAAHHRDALLRLDVQAEARVQSTGWQDLHMRISARAASGMIGPFRVVGRVELTMRHEDSANTLVSLGSHNGLRGYPSQALNTIGGHSMLVNLELRSKALEWKGVLLGGVVFYDFGTVFQSRHDYHRGMFHGFGLGLRLMLPQLNRLPWSVDGGLSVPEWGIEPMIRSGQVVPMSSP